MIGRLHIVPMIASAFPPDHDGPELRSGDETTLCALPEELALRRFGDDAAIYVGGTPTRTNGWLSQLRHPVELQDARIEFDWRWNGLRVLHRIYLDLTDEAGAADPFWTMDSSYWVLGGYSETRKTNVADKRRVMAVSAVSPSDLPEVHERTFACHREGRTFVIDERLTLHAIEFATARDLALRKHAQTHEGAAA